LTTTVAATVTGLSIPTIAVASFAISPLTITAITIALALVVAMILVLAAVVIIRIGVRSGVRIGAVILPLITAAVATLAAALAIALAVALAVLLDPSVRDWAEAADAAVVLFLEVMTSLVKDAEVFTIALDVAVVVIVTAEGSSVPVNVDGLAVLANLGLEKWG